MLWADTCWLFYSDTVDCPDDWSACPSGYLNTEIKFVHQDALNSGDILYELHQLSADVTKKAQSAVSEGKQVLYLGYESTLAAFSVTLAGVPTREMMDTIQLSYFKEITEQFLKDAAEESAIYGVQVDKQVVFGGESQLRSRSLENGSVEVRGAIRGARPAGTNVKNFASSVDKAFQLESDLYLSLLSHSGIRPSAISDGSNLRYFQAITGVSSQINALEIEIDSSSGRSKTTIYTSIFGSVGGLLLLAALYLLLRHKRNEHLVYRDVDEYRKFMTLRRRALRLLKSKSVNSPELSEQPIAKVKDQDRNSNDSAGLSADCYPAPLAIDRERSLAHPNLGCTGAIVNTTTPTELQSFDQQDCSRNTNDMVSSPANKLPIEVAKPKPECPSVTSTIKASSFKATPPLRLPNIRSKSHGSSASLPGVLKRPTNQTTALPLASTVSVGPKGQEKASVDNQGPLSPKNRASISPPNSSRSFPATSSSAGLAISTNLTKHECCPSPCRPHGRAVVSSSAPGRPIPTLSQSIHQRVRSSSVTSFCDHQSSSNVSIPSSPRRMTRGSVAAPHDGENCVAAKCPSQKYVKHLGRSLSGLQRLPVSPGMGRSTRSMTPASCGHTNMPSVGQTVCRIQPVRGVAAATSPALTTVKICQKTSSDAPTSERSPRKIIAGASSIGQSPLSAEISPSMRKAARPQTAGSPRDGQTVLRRQPARGVAATASSQAIGKITDNKNNFPGTPSSTPVQGKPLEPISSTRKGFLSSEISQPKRESARAQTVGARAGLPRLPSVGQTVLSRHPVRGVTARASSPALGAIMNRKNDFTGAPSSSRSQGEPIVRDS